MAFRIDFDAPFDQEVRRVAAEQLNSAVTLLTNTPDGPHEAVHDARKHIKRTRALYRLVASDARKFQKAENERLRSIALDLAHLRDTAALAESARYLQVQIGAGDVGNAVRHLAGELEGRRQKLADMPDMAKRMEEAAAVLHTAVHALDALDLSHGRERVADCVADGWERAGKRAIVALADCEGSENELPFHDLRKRAQDRWMHAGLLRPVWPAAMISIQKAAKSLVDLLGHEHDLAVLDEHIARSDDLQTISDRRDIIQLAILDQRHSLQRLAREAGKDVFDAKPARDAGRLRMLIRTR